MFKDRYVVVFNGRSFGLTFRQRISTKYEVAAALEFKVTDFGGSKGSGNSVDDGAFRLQALETGKQVGFVDVYRESSGWYAYEVYVEVKSRRQGVATKLYDYADELVGKRVMPQVMDHGVGDPQISSDAFLFWKKREPSFLTNILDNVTDANRKKLKKLMTEDEYAKYLSESYL